MAQTLAENWYTEELFARFSVERVDGTFDGHNPLPATGTGPTLPT
jgi:hypothetical protein